MSEIVDIKLQMLSKHLEGIPIRRSCCEHVENLVNMLQMLWTCCKDRNLCIKFTTSYTRLLQHCRGLVVALLWSDFHTKLKSSHNKDTTSTTPSQPYGNQALE